VFILKGVKVICFDTLLQVFILKDMGRLKGGGGYIPKEDLSTTEVTESTEQKRGAEGVSRRLSWLELMEDSIAG
jgi:hypothetical protein